MAERLKVKLLEDAAVDFIAGPDAYRDLPRLIDNAATELKGLKGLDTTVSEEQHSDTAVSLKGVSSRV